MSWRIAFVHCVAVGLLFGCDAPVDSESDVGDTALDGAPDVFYDASVDVGPARPAWTERDACLNDEDEWLARPSTANRLLNCAGRCEDAPQVGECARTCMEDTFGVSAPCASCFADEAACIAGSCPSCGDLTDLRRDGCAACAEQNCGPEAVACRGEVYPESPAPPRPLLSCADLGGLADPDEAFSAFRGSCWSTCRWEMLADECVEECMLEVVDVPQCAGCFGRMIRCSDACSACGVDPLGPGCQACAAPCFEVLGACTDVDISDYETPATPYGALQFVNGTSSVSRASLVVLPDGSPLFRRVPAADYAAYAFLGVGTYSLALTAGTIGTDTIPLSEVEVSIVADDLVTLISYDTESGSPALLAVPTGLSETLQVRVLNLSTRWPIVDIASEHFPGGSAELGVPTAPTGVSDTIFDVRVDLDRDGVDDVWIPSVGYLSGRQLLFIIVDDIGEPADVSAIVVSGFDALRGTTLVPLSR